MFRLVDICDLRLHLPLAEILSQKKYLLPEQQNRQLAEHGQAHAQPGKLVMPFIMVYNLPDVDRAEFVKLLPAAMIGHLMPGEWKKVWEPMIPFLLVDQPR